MRLLDRVVPITESNPAKSKRAVYRITDPYVAFWHRFVSPMISAGWWASRPGAVVGAPDRAPLDDYMGPVFEGVCRSFVRRTGRLPFAPLRVGEWWDADSRNEIDVVAIGGDGELLLGECKWGQVRLADLKTLHARADLIARELTGVRTIHFALFSGGELPPELRAEVDAGRVLHFSAGDLYAS
jgi:AAA+ ATPase superfamily predicted ATPase